MELRAFCKRLVIAGTLFIWIIKLLVRPYLPLDGSLNFVMGVTPNLVGSFLVPFGAYWIYTHPQFFNGRLLRFNFFSDMRIVCLFGFSLIVVNEYLQLIPVFGRTFDYFDIVSSALGLAVSYYSFLQVQRKFSPL